MIDAWDDDAWSDEAADVFEFPREEPRRAEKLSPLAYLILESQPDESTVLREWVEKVLPNVQVNLSLRHAKGMSPEELRRNDFLRPDLKPEQREKAVQTLAAMPVQSLAVHIVNAALSAWTVVRLAGLGEDEQRLFLAGVTMHDLNKMLERGTAELRLAGDKAADYREQFLRWGSALGLWDFISAERWQDIAFLAANAEAVRGENRTLARYDELKTDPATLEVVAEFVRLADLIASAAFHPDDLSRMRGGNKVPQILGRVLRNRYTLRFHRTAENRGLLTQVIHNVVRERAEACGWVPLLFFPDGITYLSPKEAAEPYLGDIPGVVRQKLVASVSDKLGGLVSRGPLGIKFTPEYVELLDPEAAGKLLIRRTFDIVSDKKPPVTEERKAKTQLKRNASLTLGQLDLSYPASLTADRLAEAMFGLCKLLEEYYGGARETYSEALIRGLGLEAHLQAFHSIDYSGGVGYPWYYIGGHFAKLNPGLSAVELEQRIEQVYLNVLETLGAPKLEPPFSFLDEYVPQAVTIGGNVSPRNFLGELERYERAKGRGGRKICAICNSPFETRPITDAKYSNKARINKKDEKPGICEVCQAEELLRDSAMRVSLLEAGDSKFRTKFLHIYPTYFFTPITAQALRHAYNRLKNVVFPDIAKEWQAARFDVRRLAVADIFKVSEPPNEKRRLDKVEYSHNEMHAYYLLGVPYLGGDPSETESWAMPALLSLLMPLVFGVKVVASASAQPLYPTGADFPTPTDMVVLDGVHSFWQHGMKRISFGLSDLEPAINAACAFYGLVSEAFRDGSGFVIWNQLGTVGRELDSDPLSVFGYADRIQSQAAKSKTPVTTTDGMSPSMAERLLSYYRFITAYYRDIVGEGGERMGMIEGLVDRYAAFYRAKGRAAYARLRPLSLAAEVVLDSPPELEAADLQLQIEGRINAMLDGVRDRMTEGWIPQGAWSDTERQPLVEAFAAYFLEEVFRKYCNRDRATLRARLNLLKNGAEAVYVKKYGIKQTEADQPKPVEEETSHVQ